MDARELTYEDLGAVCEALKYFAHMDQANAAIHVAEVRYSPLTFKLANTAKRMGCQIKEMFEVLDHEGSYALDPGR
jgi:hypothetical protein